MFIGRESEPESLNRAYRSGRFEFAVINAKFPDVFEIYHGFEQQL